LFTRRERVTLGTRFCPSIFNSPGIVNLLYLPFNGKKRLRNISVSGVEKGSIGEGCPVIVMGK